MTLLRAADLRLSFGSRTLFENLTLTLEEGERVGLIGVNGSGKSTLMRLLAGVIAPDAGELQVRRGTRVTYLPQEPLFPDGATIASQLDVPDVPMYEAQAVLDRLGVKAWDSPIAELSGGTRKRVAVARALVTRPDLLLLDEPTNHLDADTVDLLEEELDKLDGGLLLVTHDRYFLDDLVDRIVEILPGGGVVSYPGNYEAYLELKLQSAARAEVAQHKRDRWIAQEVAWLRRGVEARRTKSKARITRALKLMAERGLARPQVAGLRIADAPRLGGTVLEAEGVAKGFGERTLFSDVDFILQKGERIGIVGPNGAGKTTLLRVLLGELAPDAGKVVVGQKTQVAYYDQSRAQLDPEATVYDAAWGEDFVELGGQRIALRDYLDDMLFPVPMQRMKVGALSGGERNRLLLARLFLQGANVLVLDEPTNDLDIVTLNVLERLLLGFGGSVLIVTHDRYFLDKVATSILAFESGGRVVRYPGNFESYRTLRSQAQRAPAQKSQVAEIRTSTSTTARRRLSYNEQRELAAIESLIGAAETKKRALEAQLLDPSIYARAAADVPQIQSAFDAASLEVEQLYARWQLLQDLANES